MNEAAEQLYVCLECTTLNGELVCTKCGHYTQKQAPVYDTPEQIFERSYAFMASLTVCDPNSTPEKSWCNWSLHHLLRLLLYVKENLIIVVMGVFAILIECFILLQFPLRYWHQMNIDRDNLYAATKGNFTIYQVLFAPHTLAYTTDETTQTSLNSKTK